MIPQLPAARTFLILGLLVLIPASGLAEPLRQGRGPKTLWVYIGTYTDGASKGIYRFDLDLASGKLTPRGLAVATASPSFLAIHPNHRFLYAVSEVDDSGGKKTGAVSAFAINPRTGNLSLLNQQPAGGSGPCHLVVDRLGKHVLDANYEGGSACVLPIGNDGRLGKATAFVQHHGKSINPQRQEGPHAHSINLDAANRFAFVADLGLDKVFIYRYDANKGTLTSNDPPAVAVEPGAGPRHFAFHPDGRHAYVINELHSTVTAFDYDAGKGKLKAVQTVSALPKGVAAADNLTCAEVVVHPTGKFLYGSNRGHDSIAVFAVDPHTGMLTPTGHQGAGIKVPRNFAIDPSGSFLIVANQDADTLVVFRIDAKTGALKPVGQSVSGAEARVRPDDGPAGV